MDSVPSEKMETYHGYVRNPADAIKLFEACRLGLLPRVQRRLSEKERQSIRSGSVFVWDEREAGMRRWTDGKSWSASRVSGSFLTYREMEGKRGGGFGTTTTRRTNGKSPDSGRTSDEDIDDNEPEGYRYKADGLMKQSFSITTSSGQHLHLISYYARPQPGQPEMQQPTNDASLRNVVPVKGMYPESSMGEANQTPALTRAPMQQPPYMMGHHHPHHPYAPQYAQPGYGWPPSPAVTPPYGHYTAALYSHPPPPGHGLPHHHAHHGPPPPHSAYSHAPPQHYPPSHASPYERVSLPPLHSTPKTVSVPSYHAKPPAHRLSPPQYHDSLPKREGSIDASRRGSGNQLPAINSVSKPFVGAGTPPTRNASVSPPRTMHSEYPSSNGHRPSLSALLHPTPASSEAGDNAGDSPRCGGLPPPEKMGVSEDARALRMLDRKFCI